MLYFKLLNFNEIVRYAVVVHFKYSLVTKLLFVFYHSLKYDCSFVKMSRYQTKKSSFDDVTMLRNCNHIVVQKVTEIGTKLRYLTEFKLLIN